MPSTRIEPEVILTGPPAADDLVLLKRGPWSTIGCPVSQLPSGGSGGGEPDIDTPPLTTQYVYQGASAGRPANRPADPGKIAFLTDVPYVEVDNGSGWDANYAPRVYPPPAAGWSWFNQGAGTAVLPPAAGGPVWCQHPADASGQFRHFGRSVKGLPYTYTCWLKMNLLYNANLACGLSLIDSATGKFIVFMNIGGALGLNAYNTISGGFNALYSNISIAGSPFPEWLQIRDTGTTRFYEYSMDGVNFLTFYSHATGTYITPDKIALTVLPIAATPAGVTLLSFREQ